MTMKIDIAIEPWHKYKAKHVPSGETWLILGINVVRNEVCAAGWPATIAKLSDCIEFEDRGLLTGKEIQHVRNKFLGRWDNIPEL